MFIDEMTLKEKKEALKREINGASEELLDSLLLEFGFEFSEDEE